MVITDYFSLCEDKGKGNELQRIIHEKERNSDQIYDYKPLL